MFLLVKFGGVKKQVGWVMMMDIRRGRRRRKRGGMNMVGWARVGSLVMGVGVQSTCWGITPIVAKSQWGRRVWDTIRRVIETTARQGKA